MAVGLDYREKDEEGTKGQLNEGIEDLTNIELVKAVSGSIVVMHSMFVLAMLCLSAWNIIGYRPRSGISMALCVNSGIIPGTLPAFLCPIRILCTVRQSKRLCSTREGMNNEDVPKILVGSWQFRSSLTAAARPFISIFTRTKPISRSTMTWHA